MIQFLVDEINDIIIVSTGDALTAEQKADLRNLTENELIEIKFKLLLEDYE